uniref:Uncharacterized protein n=1 Tax=Arion vulgaris TaxID=1028688 RepID=A0A0B7AT31_9EUPU
MSATRFIYCPCRPQKHTGPTEFENTDYHEEVWRSFWEESFRAVEERKTKEMNARCHRGVRYDCDGRLTPHTG